MYEQPSESTNVFRDIFKYYKRRQPKPNLSDVVDFHDEDNPGALQLNLIIFFFEGFTHTKLNQNVLPNADSVDLHLNAISEWRCVEPVDRPGLYCLHNVFTPYG